MSDGLLYLAGQYLQPVLAHPDAPAVGDLGAQALRAAYFAQQHQATLIGTQTYPLRRRLHARWSAVEASSYQRIAEWCSVYLAPHHRRIEVEAQVGTIIGRVIEVYLRTVVFDGTATHTSTATQVRLNGRDLQTLDNGIPVSIIANVLALPATNLPTSSAQVRVEAYGVYEGTSTTLPLRPVAISAWRAGP